MKKNPEIDELAKSVVKEKSPEEDKTGENLQDCSVSTTSRRNYLVHVDSGLSLEIKLTKAIPYSLDKDYKLDDYESQETLDKLFTSVENERKHTTSLTGVVSNFSTTCKISDGENEIDDDSSHQQLPMKV